MGNRQEGFRGQPAVNICYLLESTELCGGVRVVFDQARALGKRGHRVLIRSLRGDHGWYPYPVNVEYVPELSEKFRNTSTIPDVLIATFWTTVKEAVKLNIPATFHFCQGLEFDFPEYSSLLPAIEEAYRSPIPKLTVGSWLSDRLKAHFKDESFRIYCVGQVVDLELFTPGPVFLRQVRKYLSKITTILVMGLFESSVKAIPDALSAVSYLREKGHDIHLIRVSSSALSVGESAVTKIDEYHTSIPPAELLKIYRRSDLFLTPSLTNEGFGLPFAEALACGVPSVATSIPSYLSFDSRHDYACFVPEKDPSAMADAAVDIIKNQSLRKRLSQRGIEVVHNKFRGEAVALNLESVFSEIAG